MIPDSLIYVGKYDEYFKKPQAGILKIENCLLKVGDTIWANKADVWKKTTIKSIQLNDVEVQSAENGEIGIVTECELDKNFEIYIKN